MMDNDNANTKTGKLSRRQFVRAAGLGSTALVGACATTTSQTPPTASADSPMHQWDFEADVVIIGSGPTGLMAAIRARDAGASVIIVETNYDTGGHGLLNGGQIHLGGGTTAQKKYGIEDSPDILFRDLTDWSVVETNGMPEYRYNDRAVQRALADNEAATYDFLVENGVQFLDVQPVVAGGHAVGISAPRGNYVTWTKGQGAESPAGAPGTSIYRPLELSARNKGVQFILNYHMDVIYREQPNAGRVLGLQASYTPRYLPGVSTPMQSFHSTGNIDSSRPQITVKANKAVIIGTGGSTGNVNFRRIFDPRMTEEYQLAGGEYSPQDASGEMAAMAIGASLWGTANQSMERNGYLRKRNLIGSQHTYIAWEPESILFPLIRATGLSLDDWQNVILVNQVGKRFYNELEGNWPNGTTHGSLDPYTQGDWRNPSRIQYNPKNFLDAATAPNEGSHAPDFAAGPVWAIFDSEAVKREEWDINPPATDPLYFFSANTLEELAEKLRGNPFQKVDMPAMNLVASVARFNEFVDRGEDPDFGRPKPTYKIQTPPFYAAWSTPVIHDCYTGLRINMKCQVIDMQGQIIPGLYCGGESAGGSSQHGQGRCTTQGYIAGAHAANEPA
jgi:FAD binding domain